MTGRLYLHIGPPKTATTALQYAFESIADENLIYGGTFQPRERNGGSLSDVLLRAMGGTAGRDRLDEVVRQIAAAIRSGKSVVISEELFGLSMATPMADKLAFLGQCFAGLPTTIILCIRNPQEAIPSLYQEIYRSQPFLTKLNFSKFCRSQAPDCYDYRKIISLLQGAGFDTIRIIGFEQVCSGNLTTRDLFDDPTLPDRTLTLPRVNTSATRDASPVRRFEPISLKLLTQTRLYGRLRNRLPVLRGGWGERLVILLGWIRIPGSEYRALTIPKEQVDHFSESYAYACNYRDNLRRADETAADALKKGA